MRPLRSRTNKLPVATTDLLSWSITQRDGVVQRQPLTPLGLARAAEAMIRDELVAEHGEEQWRDELLDPFSVASRNDRRAREQLLSLAREQARARFPEAAGHIARAKSPIALSAPFLDDPLFLNELVRFPAFRAVVGAAHSLRLSDGTTAATVHALRRWRDLLSVTGKTYRALNVTLDAIPDDEFERSYLVGLSRFRLERPAQSELHLRVLCELARVANPRLHQDHLHALQHACDHELKDAIVRLFPERSLESISRFAEALVGIAFARRGGLAELMNAADRRLKTQVRERGAAPPDDSRAVARPPIPLPQARGVTFLACIGEIRAEADRMRHCVATRIPAALRGDAFLFHVEHRGHAATVEVSGKGRIVEANGPHNTHNRAVDHAIHVVGEWAKPLLPGSVFRRYASANELTSIGRSEA